MKLEKVARPDDVRGNVAAWKALEVDHDQPWDQGCLVFTAPTAHALGAVVEDMGGLSVCGWSV